MMKNLFFKSIRNNVIISFSFAFILAFFAPLDFLYSNINDLWCDIYNIGGGVIAIAVLVCAGTFVFVCLADLIPNIGEKIAKIFKFILFYSLVAFYIQGNFIMIPYGALNGNPIDWNAYMAEDITSILAWIGIILLLVISLYKLKWFKFEKIIEYVCVLMCLITIFTLIAEYVFMGGMNRKTNMMSSTKNEWTYSRNQNINIVLLDAFDSSILYNMLSEDDEGVISDVFDGFTYYRDTLGCYNLTDYSIPLILTGQLYRGETTYGQYAEEAYSDSPMFNRLSKEGWSINLYTTVTLPQGEFSSNIYNAKMMHLKPIIMTKFIKDYYCAVAFRYMPTPLKRFFYSSFFELGANKQADMNDADSDTESVNAYDWDNMIWSNESKMPYSLSDNKIFHFYHLMGVHPPRQYNSSFQFVLDPSQVSLSEGAMFNVKMIDIWLKQLKDSGLYDNSVIIIMADHGSGELDDGYKLSQNPLLLIKGYDEHHEMQISDAPISYLDFQGGINCLMDGCKSTEAFDDIIKYYGISSDTYSVKRQGISDDDSKTGRYRVYYFSYLMNEMGNDSIGGPFYEGITEYPAYLPGQIIQTGKVY